MNMCGICGKIYFDLNAKIDAHEIIRMRETMIHRGPDDAGSFIDGPIGLGHRRLSIIDLATGRQPICNENGNIIVVYGLRASGRRIP